MEKVIIDLFNKLDKKIPAMQPNMIIPGTLLQQKYLIHDEEFNPIEYIIRSDIYEKDRYYSYFEIHIINPDEDFKYDKEDIDSCSNYTDYNILIEQDHIINKINMKGIQVRHYDEDSENDHSKLIIPRITDSLLHVEDKNDFDEIKFIDDYKDDVISICTFCLDHLNKLK